MRVFVVLFALIFAVSSKPRSTGDLVDEINSSQNLWRAAPNHVTSKGYEGVKKLLGARRSENRNDYLLVRHTDITDNSIPDEFDARTQWPECTTLQSIKDQSDCGSCWAVAAASAMSDRLCIASHGKVNVNISAQNLVSCCRSCGFGCQGGYPEKAWNYFSDNGIVTGGDYGSHEGCQPYEIKPCSNDPTVPLPPCPQEEPATPACHAKKCTNKKYHRSFKKDKHYGKTSYFVANDVKSIQIEIMKYGPVEAAFDVYEDFLTYISGVYKYVTGDYMGGHAVRVLGWGTENNTDYWLIANSWNIYWGEGGLFKIVRGTNECGIESYVVAGNVRPK